MLISRKKIVRLISNVSHAFKNNQICGLLIKLSISPFCVPYLKSDDANASMLSWYGLCLFTHIRYIKQSYTLLLPSNYRIQIVRCDGGRTNLVDFWFTRMPEQLPTVGQRIWASLLKIILPLVCLSACTSSLVITSISVIIPTPKIVIRHKAIRLELEHCWTCLLAPLYSLSVKGKALIYYSSIVPVITG